MKRKSLNILSKACIVAFCSFVGFSTLQANDKDVKNTFQNDGYKPRTLIDVTKEDKYFWDYLKENHPVFKFEKEGRLIGKYKLSNRDEEFVDFGGGKQYAQKAGRPTAITYRLAMESFLDFPNKFVGPQKCGECHPAQYAQWERSRHAKTLRWPEELEEVGGDVKQGMYGTDVTILAKGVRPDDVFAIIGTPRTKYGFLDKWLVRGTYHVVDGTLDDPNSKIVAGGNQFSLNWTKFLTPEVAQKIKDEVVPSFPTKMEEFGGNGSYIWGMNSYGASYKKSFKFQPASAYCEVCHSFKFDFKSKEEFLGALGDAKELRKHTISKGISCEECHGAGAHLYGARGAGMASNCERCHQRFQYHEDDAKLNPRKEFNAYFKSSCPACGTEGSQMYSSMHYDKGLRCSTCHDPHEVTANDWKDSYTLTGLKKNCKDCHEPQAEMFKYGGPHAKDNCTGCHMPNMMSCENFPAIQNPDLAGFDNVRASHIWKILVDKDKKTLNPPAGKARDPKVKGWRLAREDGRFFVDLMWSCGRTSFEDPNLVKPGASGCHSVIQSTLPKELHYKDQASIYEDVMKWQNPVKDGYANIEQILRKIDKSLIENKKISNESKTKVLSYAKQAQDILDRIKKDGSWGVHGPKYAKKLIDEALTYANYAQDIIDGKSK
ncbi:cytochrome c family protein [Campylobacter pinnipediorum subsp. caledonicus]|uniref:Cytochrome c family protein n=1 Tax=Campylobacter pinnipediorum subsp. caledonicus TaxID=1874362 RepID=A0A1S6U8F6_9BACT|nr:cytochrome c3 family protein [Campylobacter pinnipediorum]AQW86299.1 cytochrome c family protein [Campylobacter pinnipediorum subsp. caledonicus]AQW87952.1 cytochrome c family protein [Campylobacter pinnipediorum subsp. caledonicus]